MCDLVHTCHNLQPIILTAPERTLRNRAYQNRAKTQQMQQNLRELLVNQHNSLLLGRISPKSDVEKDDPAGSLEKGRAPDAHSEKSLADLPSSRRARRR